MSGVASVTVRAEEPRDRAAVHALTTAAFGSPAEADLVDRLRRDARPLVSLVAEEHGAVVGHVSFSPVLLPAAQGPVMGLAPMAVVPARQRAGIGSALVRAGLDACRALGATVVVVLGHPAYYPRFGFVPASRFGVRCAYDAPDEAFLALELVAGALAGATGTVRYHPAFDELPEGERP